MHSIRWSNYINLFVIVKQIQLTEYKQTGIKMEFVKISIDEKRFYWTLRDTPFIPYEWLEEKDLKHLPRPFILFDIHPDCPLGFESEQEDDSTNIIKLADSFFQLLSADLRKDLRRIEKKNSDLRIVENEAGALDKSRRWFLEVWKEDEEEFKRRLELWKQRCYTLSAYLNEELIAVHIALREKDTIYYFGCWWNRTYKNRSVPIFLLKKDIERAIAKKIKYCDLGVGNEAYKKKWGVIRKPTKYYAIVTRDMAKRLGIENYTEISY